MLASGCARIALNALPQRRRCAVIRLSVVKRHWRLGDMGKDDNDAGGIPIGMSCHVYSEGDGWLIIS